MAQRKGGAAPSLAKQAAAKVNGQLPASTLAHITRAHDAKRTKNGPRNGEGAPRQDRTAGTGKRGSAARFVSQYDEI